MIYAQHTHMIYLYVYISQTNSINSRQHHGCWPWLIATTPNCFQVFRSATFRIGWSEKRQEYLHTLHKISMVSPHKGPVMQSVDVFFLSTWTTCWAHSRVSVIWNVMMLMWHRCKETGVVFICCTISPSINIPVVCFKILSTIIRDLVCHGYFSAIVFALWGWLLWTCRNIHRYIKHGRLYKKMSRSEQSEGWVYGL